MSGKSSAHSTADANETKSKQWIEKALIEAGSGGGELAGAGGGDSSPQIARDPAFSETERTATGDEKINISSLQEQFPQLSMCVVEEVLQNAGGNLIKATSDCLSLACLTDGNRRPIERQGIERP